MVSEEAQSSKVFVSNCLEKVMCKRDSKVGVQTGLQEAYIANLSVNRLEINASSTIYWKSSF